jgi:peptidoglycan/xylan/chitin deacetylase (PgdA/CDA1 family)
LQEFRFPATFFVVSSFIRGADWIWTDKVTWLSEQSHTLDELRPENLGRTFHSLNRLRPEDRNRRIQSMAARAGLPLPEKAPPQYAACSWTELREMSQSGLVEIGSHTVTHPILSSLTDEESWQELTESRREIKAALGEEVRCFCLPNGMPADFRSGQIRQIAEAGYACSVLADFGLVEAGSDRYQMRRIGMGRKTRPIEIAKYVDGAVYYQRKLGNLFGKRVALENEFS